MVEKHWPCFAEKPWACTFRPLIGFGKGLQPANLIILGHNLAGFMTATKRWQIVKRA